MKALLHRFILLLITKPFLLLATSLGVFIILRFSFISDVEPLHTNSFSINSIPDQDPLPVPIKDHSWFSTAKRVGIFVGFLALVYIFSDPVNRDALCQILVIVKNDESF